MTLMSFGNSEHTRRCTALCYDAKGPDCDCICGGANHGKGLEAAAEWTREHGRQLLERAGVRLDERDTLFAEVRS